MAVYTSDVIMERMSHLDMQIMRSEGFGWRDAVRIDALENQKLYLIGKLEELDSSGRTFELWSSCSDQELKELLK